MTKQESSSSMKAFTIIWFGQLVSFIGSGLTQFAMSVWVFTETESVTLFGLILVFSTLPGILLFPITGALIDRWDRKRVLVMSDTAAALATLAVVVLLWQDQLAVWHVYIVTAVISTATSFQLPAFTASMTLLVPSKQLGRAGGMMQFNEAASGIVAPLLAGFLVTWLPLQNIILIDVVTFLFAVATLAVAAIPNPQKSEEELAKPKPLLRDAATGWNFVKARKGLAALLLFFVAFNYARGTAQVLFMPLLLTLSTAAVLGMVIAVGSAGMLLGSLLMSWWGGPKRRVRGVLAFGLIYGFAVALFGVRPAVPLIMVAAFSTLFLIPLIGATNQVIWQTKVPPELQGRVFSTRLMVGWSTAPLAYLLSGPLVDRVFEPLMAEGGALADTVVGQLLGVGPGRGIGLLYVLIGLLPIAAAAAAALVPSLRNLEDELPDAVPSEPAAVIEEEAEPDELVDYQPQPEGAAD